MTLKEKFESIEFSFPSDESEKIADDFAIGFAEWRNSLYVATDYKNLNTKELLEIYKKEKGL